MEHKEYTADRVEALENRLIALKGLCLSLQTQVELLQGLVDNYHALSHISYVNEMDCDTLLQ